jgi:hypothetical protein
MVVQTGKMEFRIFDKEEGDQWKDEKMKFLAGRLPTKRLIKIEVSTQTWHQYSKDTTIWSVFIVRVLVFEVKYPGETLVPILGIKHRWVAYHV